MNENITMVLSNVKNRGSLMSLNYGYIVANMKYGERLKAARNHAKLTQAQLAEKIERACTQENISKLERGNATGSEFTALFAKACGVDAIWLATNKGKMLLKHNQKNMPLVGNFNEGPPIGGKIPLISSVQAGDWRQVIDNLQPGEGERIATTYRAKTHTYALRVKGDSMEPQFPDGAILIVEPEEELTPGKFVIIRQNGGEATFKQLIKDGNKLYLKPLNPRYPILELAQDAVFCGVVKRVEMDV